MGTLWTFVLLFAVFTNPSVASAKDSLTADDKNEEGPSLDRIFANEAIVSQLELIEKSAKDPSTIENFAQDDQEYPGSVRLDNDMLFTAEQYANIDFLDDDNLQEKKRKKRKAIKSLRYRWPNNVVPYRLSSGHFNSRDIRIINGAIGEWQRETCLRFKRTSSDRNHVRFQNGGGCSSYVGKIGGSQPLTLARGCRVHGIVVHEIGHAIGFQHEQTRPDRDKYVTIHNANIHPRTLFNFRRFDWSSVVSHGVPYDYQSVMHYGHYAFSRNGRKTITVKDARYRGKIGNRRGLSFRDAKLANLIYKCAERKGCPRKKCPGEGFVDQNCDCKCPGSSTPTRKCSSTGTVAPGRTTRPPVTRNPRTPRPTGNCQDTSSYCKMWSFGNGCKVFYSIMSRLCRKTCNLCRKKPCIDKNRYCKVWKRRNLCTSSRYKAYMRINCQLSCGTCVMQTKSEDIRGECENKSPFCQVWSMQGYCETKSDSMKKRCMRTCGFCS